MNRCGSGRTCPEELRTQFVFRSLDGAAGTGVSKFSTKKNAMVDLSSVSAFASRERLSALIELPLAWWVINCARSRLAQACPIVRSCSARCCCCDDDGAHPKAAAEPKGNHVNSPDCVSAPSQLAALGARPSGVTANVVAPERCVPCALALGGTPAVRFRRIITLRKRLRSRRGRRHPHHGCFLQLSSKKNRIALCARIMTHPPTTPEGRQRRTQCRTSELAQVLRLPSAT